jgi:hypothetical protein
MQMRTFRLYPKEQRWWSFNDYDAVLTVMERLHPESVLEFGPGSSTLALIEGGAEKIDTCEDDPKWFSVYHQRLELKFPQVHLVAYSWAEPLRIAEIDDRRYDMALIDGPLGTERRPHVLDYCLARCTAVLMATETWKTKGLRTAIAERVDIWHRYVEWMDTGPLSGGFALVTRPC